MYQLTKSQERTIEYLRKKFSPREGYEFKKNEVELDTFDCVGKEKTIVYLHIETGLIDDEGSLAEVFARTRRWFRIGKRGGIKSFDGNSSNWKNSHFETW